MSTEPLVQSTTGEGNPENTCARSNTHSANSNETHVIIFVKKACWVHAKRIWCLFHTQSYSRMRPRRQWQQQQPHHQKQQQECRIGSAGGGAARAGVCTSWSSWERIPERSMERSRQNSISASGPASSPSSVLSWWFTTSLICRVQWISVDSSRCTCPRSAQSSQLGFTGFAPEPTPELGPARKGDKASGSGRRKGGGTRRGGGQTVETNTVNAPKPWEWP